MEDKQKDRLPPGQVLTGKWPVLSYGETPRLEFKDWRFRLFGQVDREQALTWDEFMALPKVERTSDIHCVTRWSRFSNRWEGVLAKELVKLAHKYAENARVAVRHVRRDGLDVLKKLEKDHKISEDDQKHESDLVQKATDQTITEIDQALAAKEKEILTV